MRRFAIPLLVLLALVALAGCGGPKELPSRMPDVLGETLEDAVDELQDDGFTDIILFTNTIHAVDPWDGMIADDEPVTNSKPEPGDDTTEEVWLWLGPEADIPEDVADGAWYYPHGERIEDRGTDGCLTCHDPDWCSICHEARLQETDKLFSVQPLAAPTLAEAAARVLDISTVRIDASYRGDHWYQVDLEAPADDPRGITRAAREMALELFPAGFAAEEDCETLVFRWMSLGDPVMEIGFERATFEAEVWDLVGQEDIPWIADRYATSSS